MYVELERLRLWDKRSNDKCRVAIGLTGINSPEPGTL